MLPITGPYSYVKTTLGPPNVYGFRPDWKEVSRTWYRQRRPYGIPLLFHSTSQEVLSFRTYISGAKYGYVAECPVPADGSPNGPHAKLYNKAYAQFISRLKPDTAGLGINLAQRRQAVDMIAKRSLQLVSFVRHLKAFRLGDAAKSLGLDSSAFKKNKKLRRGSKSFANNFLELHFGWSPLVGDIGSSVDVLQGGVPPSTVRGSAKTSGGGSSTWQSGSSSYFNTSSYTAEFKIAAKVAVTNPNLFLANQLGVVNPALIAYDAVPFSFVLNWFINVEQFLASFTDLWGVSLSDSYYTFHGATRLTKIVTALNYPEDGMSQLDTAGSYVTVTTKRTPGAIPGPTLRPLGPWTISPTRGLTAISLLVQQLKK